jgi:Fe(II)/alpha-ketoglutarate-dependent arginine beta-hydroxylase
MMILELDKWEIDNIVSLLAVVMQEYQDETEERFLRHAQYLAYKLPQRLCEFLTDFKQFERSKGACLIRGLPVDDLKLGPTPTSTAGQLDPETTRKEHFLSVLLSSVLGDVFGWATQQDGKLVHDLAPIKEHENQQIGSGSRELITLHCEDAFHEFRADYLGLYCLRNPDGVSTTYATLDLADLTTEQQSILHQPVFTIRPDNSHLELNNAKAGSQPDRLKQEAFLRIQRQLETGIPISLLFGDREDPYLRLDAYFMDKPTDPQHQDAFDALCSSLQKNSSEVILQPGDMLFVDNYRVLHGRKPFAARFDGRDRWLKRLNITRDLRRSRAVRPAPGSRVIY